MRLNCTGFCFRLGSVFYELLYNFLFSDCCVKSMTDFTSCNIVVEGNMFC